MGQPRRPDQSFDPPPASVSPNSQGGIFRGHLVLVFGSAGQSVGVFVYTPGTTPATGNQPLAWITNQTVDPYNNPVLPDLGAGDLAGNQTVLTSIGLTVQSSAGHVVGTLSYIASAHPAFYLEASAFSALMSDPIAAVLPGSPPNPVPETWHTVSVFGIGFAAGSPAPRFRIEPVGSAGVVRLAGVVSVTANTLAAATMFTLNAGYHPTFTQSFVTTNSTGTVAGGSVSVTTGGVVQCAPASANGDAVFLDGITFPID